MSIAELAAQADEWARRTMRRRYPDAPSTWHMGIEWQECRDERFAELVRAEERERCARLIERRAEERFNEHGTREYDTNACYYAGPEAGEYEVRDEEDEDCAAAIRGQP